MAIPSDITIRLDRVSVSQPEGDHNIGIYIGNILRYTEDANPILFQCWSSVCDAGPTLKQHWVVLVHYSGDPCTETELICVGLNKITGIFATFLSYQARKPL